MIEVPKRLEQYVQYIRNTGRVPLPKVMFDEDWDPIGPMVRFDLRGHGLIEETQDGIILKAGVP